MKKNYIKIVLDSLMAITFALLMDPKVLNGLPFHEIAGLVLGVAILTHIGLNFKWVKNTTLKILDSKLPTKTRFNYLLNILLLVSMSSIIITGILISRVVFPNIGTGENHAIRGLHSLSANVTLALVGLHIGVHWQWVISIFKKMFISAEGKPRKGVVALALFALISMAGGIQWYSSTTSTSAAEFNQNQIQPKNDNQAFNNVNLPYDNQSSSDSINQNANFQIQQNGDFRGHGAKGGPHGKQNALLEILTYFGIFAALIIPTVYLEKRLLRKKPIEKTPKLTVKDATY